MFEAIPSAVTEELMALLEIPVIGIGAGPATDGQVLVFHDLLGIRDGLGARFVKRYANLQQEMNDGVSAYAEDVRSRRYPGPSTPTRSTPTSSPSCTSCCVRAPAASVLLGVFDPADHLRGHAGGDRERLDVAA